MRRFRFTQKALEGLSTSSPREWVYDEQVPRLALMVTQMGAKSFYAVKTLEGKRRFVRIGSLQDTPIPLARKQAAEIVLKMLSGEFLEELAAVEPPPALTLGQAYEEYRRYLERHRKANTIYQYERQWEKFIKPWAGERPMQDIRRREVVALHQEVGDTNGHHQANRVVALVRAVINRSIREHELEIPNPANAITFYREGRRSRRLMPEELPAFFKALGEEPNEDIRDFVHVSLFTGARKANVMGMRWSDISMERGLWVVPVGDSKTSKELDIVLSEHVLSILRERRSRVPGDFVFPGRNGRTNEHMQEPRFGWLRICERAGLKNLHIHDLRRSLASFQIDTGTPLEVIQKTLGHESKTTTEIYARLALDTVRASVELAALEILKGCNQKSSQSTCQ